MQVFIASMTINNVIGDIKAYLLFHYPNIHNFYIIVDINCTNICFAHIIKVIPSLISSAMMHIQDKSCLIAESIPY